MFPLRDLQYLLEPSSLALVATALSVVLLSAFRALIHDRESERHRDMSASAITLDTNRALLLPLASSVSLLLMFYLFATVSQLVTAFAAVASASATCFALSPLVAWLNTSLGLQDPLITVYFPSFSLWSGQHGNSNNSNSSSSNSSSSNTSSNSNSSSSGSRRGEGGGSSGGTLLGEGMRGRESRSSTNINSSSNSSDGHNRSVSRNNSASGKTNTSTTTSTTTTSTSTSTSTSSSSAYITAGEGGSTVLGAVTRMQLVLGVLSGALVLCWLVSGHWLLNNALGTAICVAFVSHVRLPNVKVSALLLACLFAYDIFWVFFSHASSAPM
ncbi:hypothetical protein CLOP_g12302 [Closterium sp. NIES-67]|nr:hypothetical protein CLOP_g12302 [Closterium sp. NIES-67]